MTRKKLRKNPDYIAASCEFHEALDSLDRPRLLIATQHLIAVLRNMGFHNTKLIRLRDILLASSNRFSPPDLWF